MTQNIINIASQMIMFHSSMLKENRKNLPIYRFSFQNKKGYYKYVSFLYTHSDNMGNLGE